MENLHASKITLICEIAMLLSGLLILGIAIAENGSTYTHIAGGAITVAGAIYILTGIIKRKQR